MAKAKVTTVYKDDDGQVTNTNDEQAGDLTMHVLRKNLIGGLTDLLCSLSFTVANILAFSVSIRKSAGETGKNADGTPKTVTLRIETNSASSPADTLNLTETNGISWSYGSSLANPFTTNVTAFYLTVTGTATVDFEMRMLLDLETEVSSSSSSINSSSSSSSTSSVSSSSLSVSTSSSVSSSSTSSLTASSVSSSSSSLSTRSSSSMSASVSSSSSTSISVSASSSSSVQQSWSSSSSTSSASSLL